MAGELDGAIRAVDPRATPVRGVSRTDAGVHAYGQLAAFDTEREIEPRGWVLAIGQNLPPQVAVRRAARVEPGYDPRGHVVSKLYRYLIYRSQTRDPFFEGRAWRVGHRLNHALMQREAQALVGHHDFSAFRGAADQRTDGVRQILRAEVRSACSNPRCLQITVEGDRFLYHMVRIIAGTLVEVGRGRLRPGAILRAFASRSRTDLGVTAPPDGLYLERIQLDQPTEHQWPSGEASN